MRCGSVVFTSRPVVVASHASLLPEPAAQNIEAPSFTIRAPLSAFDSWALEEQLRHVDRILSGARFTTEFKPDHTDAPSQLPPPRGAFWQQRAAPTGKQASAGRVLRTRLSWLVVAIGAAALASGICMLCGGALLGRPRWQSFGLPITLLGQVALLLGMMMQLDLVWKGKRETASKLYRFQKRLGDLEVLADELTPTSAEESPPPVNEQELLAELKHRLDILSHRLNVPCG